MAITDNIITTAEVNALKVAAETRQRIQGEPDTVKAIIDRLPLKIVEKYNALIATLQKQTTGSGAEQIGCAAIPGVNDDESGTIREMLVSLKELINNAVISGLDTNSVDETYLTADAVMLSLLTDYAIASAGTPAALATTDTVAEALGKIERILSNILAGVQAAGKATDYSTSGGIATALAGKQATLTWDTTPTAASNNPVRSDGIKTALDLKAPLESPTFTGTVTVPNGSVSGAAVNKGQLDTKENIDNKKTSLADNSDTYYPTQKAVTTALALKAPLANPTFTGTVTVPAPTNPTDAARLQDVTGLAAVYDKVIKTQAEFEALIGSETWLNATSVALVGQFTLSTANNSGVKIPSTVKQIHGFNSAKITITNFKYDVSTAKGGLWYATVPTTQDNSIRDLEVSCTGSTLGLGFINCNNLSNCTATGTGTVDDGYGFYNCNNLSNCTATGTGTYGYGFSYINYAVNCKDGGSSTNMWDGTNKNIDPNTCCKTPVTANISALNT